MDRLQSNREGFPPGAVERTSIQENSHGRTKSVSNAGHAWPDRPDQQRNGTYCSRRISLAHFLHSSHDRNHRTCHVDRHLRRAAALSGYRGGLCRDLQTLSRHGFQLLLCGAGVALQGQVLQVCAYREIHRRLGFAPLLLGLSRRNGGHDRHLRRLRGRISLSWISKWLQSRPAFYGPGGGRLLVFCRMDRLKGRGSFHLREPCNQHHSNLSSDAIQRSGSRLPHQSSCRRRGLPVRRTDVSNL